VIYTPTEAHSWIFVTGGSFFARQMLAKKTLFSWRRAHRGTVRTKMSHWPDHVKKVYARMPDGYNAYYNGVFHCCEVGNLYGHPIAGRNWYMALCHRMKYYGYEQSAHDPCLFHKYEGGAMSRRRVPAHGPLHGRHPHFCAQGLLALQRLEGVVRQGVHVDRL